MNYRMTAVTALLFLMGAATGHAEQDFYGIEIQNEIWAKKLVWDQPISPNQPEYNQIPIINHQITAEAALKEISDEKLDVRITINNEGSEAVSTDYHARDFFITTRDGRKYPLIDEDQNSDSSYIDAKSKVTFSPSTGNLKIKNKDVILIECSFGFGKNKIFLFPWSKKEFVAKLTPPPSPPEALKEVRKEHGLTGWFSGGHKAGEAARPVSHEPPQLAPRQEVSKNAPLSKEQVADIKLDEAIKKFIYTPSNTAPSAVQALSSQSLSRDSAASSSAPVHVASVEAKPSPPSLTRAIQNFTYRASDQSIKDANNVPKKETVPARAVSYPSPSLVPELRAEAHVIGVNKVYNFITLDLGVRDGLKENTSLNVMRNGKIVARARVKQLRDAVSAAAIIPPVQSEILPGDLISLA